MDDALEIFPVDLHRAVVHLAIAQERPAEVDHGLGQCIGLGGGGGQGFEGFADAFGDIFGDIFGQGGGGRRGGGPQVYRGSDLSYAMEITLEEGVVREAGDGLAW